MYVLYALRNKEFLENNNDFLFELYKLFLLSIGNDKNSNIGFYQPIRSTYLIFCADLPTTYLIPFENFVIY